jgi:hypothetical protein
LLPNKPNFATVESVQWIYNKVNNLGYAVTTGHIKGNALDQILIVETDFDTVGSKDGIHADMPTVTVIIFRKTLAECYTVFNTIRPQINADLDNGIRGAKVVGRETGYINESEMYALKIEIDIRVNI